MENHPEFFESVNIFYKNCLHGVVKFLDELSLEESQNYIFCKLIENTLPSFMLPIFIVDTSKNNALIEMIMKEFFKIYVTINFDLEQVMVSKIYENNISVLFTLRNIFFFDESFYEQRLSNFLPPDNYLVTQEKLSKATESFVDLILFKLIDKTRDFLATDSRMYFYTLFEMFEQPFDVY